MLTGPEGEEMFPHPLTKHKPVIYSGILESLIHLEDLKTKMTRLECSMFTRPNRYVR
jgi:hypothetical protein